jgi:hypothetical protein
MGYHFKFSKLTTIGGAGMEVATSRTSQEASSDAAAWEETMYAFVMAALMRFPWVATAYIAWGSSRAYRHGPPKVREESIVTELARGPCGTVETTLRQEQERLSRLGLNLFTRVE